MKQKKQLILASASPRRSELLTQLGLTFSVLVTDIDETAKVGEVPEDYVRRMAVEKALAGWQRTTGGLPVLGADTVVLLDGQILCKPKDRAEAASMLQSLSGREHFVLSAVALVSGSDDYEVVLNKTGVRFADMPDQFIQHYCASDKPLDKAGAYAIQGTPGLFVSSINGSYSGVMGLPLYETGCLLRAAGVFV